MTTDMLRCALRGVAAYRPVVDEPVMRLALGVLDKLSAGDGSGAVEDYARLFYALRSAGSRSLGEWLDGRLRDRESPYAALAERGGEDPALEAPGGILRRSPCWRSWTGTRCSLRWGGKRRGSMGRCWPTCPGGGGAARFLLRS